MRILLLLIFFQGFLQFGLTQVHSKLEIPTYGKNDTIVQHTGYCVSYNHRYKQANWVAYQLTALETIKVVDRENKFKADPLILETNLAKDYLKSGYDRGHLAPSADMTYSRTTMLESFYYSNMSPQAPLFNRNIWNDLEELTRTWAKEYDSLYIVVGPVLGDSLSAIGPHKVAVPKYYYKVILDNQKNKEKAIAFIMKNEGSSLSLKTFVVSIDEIELLTGIDFFPKLENTLEKSLESKKCLECWKWGK